MQKPDKKIIHNDYLLNKNKYLYYAMSWGQDRNAAEDIIHSVYLNLMKKKCLPQDITLYIYRSIRHKIIDMHRRQTTEKQLHDNMPGYDPHLQATEHEHLNYHLMKLNDKYRECLVLKTFHAMTFASIAELLKESPNTISSRYRRALNIIRENLKKEQNNDS
ncbi:RNA polymerase sigma factor [Lentisphaerota bacterium ZTH]|nr:RNA polymerase sigma factor [Lentisphaerota bacterium]WET05724.1 RNA polymerase sigma factor [Lentisphaerota bacterium ZTH]